MKRIVIFDLEATCEDKEVNPNYPKEIIEIGAVDNFGNEFSYFIKPIQRPILTDFCKNLTSITQEDVDNASSFKVVFPKFLEFIGDSDIISWGNYDKNQLCKDLKLNNFNYEYSKIIRDKHSNLKELYQQKTGKHSGFLPKAMKQIGLSFDGNLHRGIDDARNILKVYEKLTK